MSADPTLNDPLRGGGASSEESVRTRTELTRLSRATWPVRGVMRAGYGPPPKRYVRPYCPINPMLEWWYDYRANVPEQGVSPAMALNRYLQARKWMIQSARQFAPGLLFFAGVPNWVRMVIEEFVENSGHDELVLEDLFWQELRLALSKPAALRAVRRMLLDSIHRDEPVRHLRLTIRRALQPVTHESWPPLLRFTGR